MEEIKMEEIKEEQVPESVSGLGTLYAKKLSGWTSFIAIVTIIGGAITCLGIITAAVGIPMIFAGLKLLKAVEHSKAFAESNDVERLSASLDNLNLYFKINGIVAVVGISIYILLLLLLLFGVLSLPNMSSPSFY